MRVNLTDREAASRPALRYHGGKFRLATWLMTHIPAHDTYTETFGGGAGLLLRKERSKLEIYNDLDGDVVNFFQVIRDPISREMLMESLALTPFARAEFDTAYEPTEDSLERARRLAIKSWMGFGSASAVKSTTGFRMSAKDVALWSRLPDVIAITGKRFEGVLIEHRPATSVLMKHDSKTTFHYVDPPYLFATRDRASKHIHRYYRHEMSDFEHVELITCLHNLKGMVMISGYDSPLYREDLNGWDMKTYRTAGGSNRGSMERTEVIWMNQAAREAIV